jgi:hypothetical protein
VRFVRALVSLAYVRFAKKVTKFIHIDPMPYQLAHANSSGSFISRLDEIKYRPTDISQGMLDQLRRFP